MMRWLIRNFSNKFFCLLAISIILPSPTALAVREDVDAFVTRFYQQVLDREPDTQGLNGWVDGLLDGSVCGSGVAFGFVNSQEFFDRNTSNEDYIDILYQSFFGREPEQPGHTGWLNYLNNGGSRQFVLDLFIYSQEFEELSDSYGITPACADPPSSDLAEFVQRFYTITLGREPDINELNGWVNGLLDGSLSGSDVANSFINSQEFISRKTSNEFFITILYRAFFRREPDPFGYNGWFNFLNNAGSRQVVLDGFITSLEFETLCSDYGLQDRIYMIDAHSQIPSSNEGGVDLYSVLKNMDENNMYRTILMARGQVQDSLDLADFAEQNSSHIIAAVSMKVGSGFETNDTVFLQALSQQVDYGKFNAMGEMLLYHAEKYDPMTSEVIAPEVMVYPNDVKVIGMVGAGVANGWPAVLHIEFRGLESAQGVTARNDFMQKLEDLVSNYGTHPFVLAHMAELSLSEVSRLISHYSNVYFTTTLKDLTVETLADLPSYSEDVDQEWIDLIEQYSARFIFILDRVWSTQWEMERYNEDIEYSLQQISRLSDDAREAFLHGNAEKLWQIEPKED